MFDILICLHVKMFFYIASASSLEIGLYQEQKKAYNKDYKFKIFT